MSSRLSADAPPRSEVTVMNHDACLVDATDGELTSLESYPPSPPATRLGAVTHGGEINQEITRRVVRCFRTYVGRGPTKAQAFYHGDVLVVVMRDVMTEGERLVVKDGQHDAALGFRQALNNGVRESLVTCVEDVVGKRVVSVMISTDVAADTASCVFIIDGLVTVPGGRARDPDADAVSELSAASRRVKALS